MLFGLDRKDLLYLAILTALTFTLLAVYKDTTLLGYQRLAELKLQQQMPSIDLTYFPAFLGVVLALAFYLAVRVFLKYQPFPVFVASMLLVASKAFTNNFAAGNISEIVLLFFGQLVQPAMDVSFAKFAYVLFLLPLALFSAYMLLAKKGEKNNLVFALIVVAFALPLVYPLAALPFLAVLSAHTLERHREKRRRDEMIFGAFLTAIIFVGLLGFTTQKVAIAVFAGALMGAIIYTLEFRKKLNAALLVLLFFLSIQGAAMNVAASPKLDLETKAALSQLKPLDQNARIAVISPYLDNITAPAFIIADKRVSYLDGFSFLFTSVNLTPKFDYLLLDTLALDDPKRIAMATEDAPRFESFYFVQTGMQNDTRYAVFYSTRNPLVIPVDNKGNPISNTVYIGGQEESLFKLLELNATDAHYIRYIHPRTDTDINVFRLLFPEKFGQFETFNATQIWQSNTSRMRLYRIAQ